VPTGLIADVILMAQDSRVAIFPGSFDPLTNGHLDLIERSARLFDRVIVAVLTNSSKQPLFPVKTRLAMLSEVFKGRATIEVDAFRGLLVDYARTRGARVVVRGIRGVTDFDGETQMALMNRRLDADLETVFLAPSASNAYISSRLVREIATLGGSLEGLVPPVVAKRLAAGRQPSTLRRA
jgi:pantetheine-phosphate adenylyltransferase